MKGLGQAGLLVAALLICHSAVSVLGSGYGQQSSKKVMKMMEVMMTERPEKPKKMAKMPEERCKKVGQFLAIPGERCIFHVCDYGHEPWRDAYGKIKLFTVEMPCAPGTYVQGDTSSGYPCTGRSDKMCLPKKESKRQRRPIPRATMMKLRRMYKKQEEEQVTEMIEEQMKAVHDMDFEQVVKLVKNLASMLESQMYTVLKLTPKTEAEKMDVMVIKDEVKKMTYRADSAVNGDNEMRTEDMRDMCIQMMDLMREIVEMKVEINEKNRASHPTGYGMSRQDLNMKTSQKDEEIMKMPYGMLMDMMSSSGSSPQTYEPVMVMMNVDPTAYPAMPEQEVEMTQGYGMPVESNKMRKMKKMMSMVESMMDMVRRGYGAPMMDGNMPVEQVMIDRSQGYGKMEEVKPRKRKMKVMRPTKMRRTSGYGQMKPMKMRKMRKRRPRTMMRPMKQERKPVEMTAGYGMPQPEQMKTEYGEMAMDKPMEKPAMMGYGQMDDKMMGDDMGQVIYVLYPTFEETQQMEEMMPTNTRSSY